ncbi:MAG: 16S rRNA (cytosine(1402)-N(4))-methyltransferase RsmH [Pseudobacteriovorax sp.]|nr:16S rRNA (cytosine(1402)-N(4))-methyltransferase RsmH [Pseudobacteriovorax sp.]
MTFDHITVLKDELVSNLNLKSGSLVIDCTAGGGGHTARIAQSVQPGGRVIAVDRDLKAIDHLKTRFSNNISSGEMVLVQKPFSELASIVQDMEIHGKVDGICADIGVSSPQIDDPERGFSFMKDGPLDMRMDRTCGISAYQVVNEYSEAQLTQLFRSLGEEPKAKFAAQGILKERAKKPIETTRQLAEIIENNLFYKTKSKKHPATRVFQALRMHVNGELEELETLCKTAFEALRPGGRLGIISFHSLEDKIVKSFFKSMANGNSIPPEIQRAPIPEEEIERLKDRKAKLIKPFPIVPGKEEIEFNVRARSAKLRVLEKI